MSSYFNPERPHFWINLLCEEVSFPEVRTMDSFLHNLNLLYEISRVATDINYELFPMFQLLSSRRDGTVVHIRTQDRLYLEKISKKSPMELATVVLAVPSAVGAIWGLVQIFEKVVNFRLNRRELQEEVRKLQLENSNISKPVFESDSQSSEFLFENPTFFEARLRERGAWEQYQAAAEALRTSQISIIQVEIELRNIPRQHNNS